MEIKKNLTAENFDRGNVERIKYIVIHYTSNNGDTALSNTNYFKQYRGASAHYFVDENNIYQSIEDKNVAWHCGAKSYKHKYCRNSNSIGVEMCSRRDSKGNYYFKDKTVDNAIELVKMLMAKYNVPIENVVRHYDVTGKICPEPFVRDSKAWNKFKERLTVIEGKKEDDEMITETQININGKNYTINRILKNGKNFVKLTDFKQAGFDIGYNEKTKVPSFGVTADKKTMRIEGENKTVNTIMKNNENYIRLRDLDDILDIGYENGEVIINNKK